MRLRTSQNGFTAIEAVLVTIVIGLLGISTWLFYERYQQKATVIDNQISQINSFEDCAAAGNPISQTFPEQCRADGKTYTKMDDSSNETSDWLVYTSPNKEFSVQLADGWNLTSSESGLSLYTFSNENTNLTIGSRAIISPSQGGRDGRSGFFMNYVTQSTDQINTPGTKQSSLKTADGLEISKYFWVVSGYQNGGPGVANGDSQYTYVLRKSPTQTIVVDYSFQTGQADHSLTIEKVLKTVRFN